MKGEWRKRRVGFWSAVEYESFLKGRMRELGSASLGARGGAVG